MNVMFVSQCSKNALRETRRILDQFAERRGDRTWQTPITRSGLDTLHRLLRKSARKNTAVACHWIRGHDHSELLWIVGDAGRFNTLGAAPTNTTHRKILRNEDENDWHSLPDIHLLAALAALLHDLGKACRAFQHRLTHPSKDKNLYRHEWVSLRLFQAFVGHGSDDHSWLKRLVTPTAEDNASWLDRLQRDGLDSPTDAPLASLPPLAQAIGWLVLTHHRLPLMPVHKDEGGYERLGARVPDFRTSHLDQVLDKIRSDWNELPTTCEQTVVAPYWEFPHSLPVDTPAWQRRASKLAARLLERLSQKRLTTWTDNPYVMHLARLALMLADHHYSSLTQPCDRIKGKAGYPLYANTSAGKCCQPLDEHLLGVEKHTGAITHAITGFDQHLPRLARHQGLRRRSTNERFRWQNRASDLAFSMRERSKRQGAFLVNMASTGCGKTLANARIMNGLADPVRGMRCAFALGLRTLTLQTGNNFRELLQLSDDELAIRIGGKPSRELYEHYQEQAERTGSESIQALLPEDKDTRVLYDGNSSQPLLKRAMKDRQVRSLLAAPLLVCTVDHLVPATESQRGGRQIAPMLRLMSGDLVLDELDDFDLADLPALTRLVYWAGLLGARVLISSATLPPALAQGMFEAYRAGRAIYQQNRGERPGEPLDVCCAWFDEFAVQAQDCPDANGFAETHAIFSGKRHQYLQREQVRRLSRLVVLHPDTQDRQGIREYIARVLLRESLDLHAEHHSVDHHSGKRVSFGLIRMANIAPLFDVAMALYRQSLPTDYRVHLCVYHSQYPLLLRSAIERRLDAALNRKQETAVFDLPDIRQRVDTYPETDQLFVVLGSPVTEVGRDHDYDWAVVEPSSMRSLIQLAGRVRRHRSGACEIPNIALLDTNLKHFERPGKAAFCRPGFENDQFILVSHRLDTLLSADERDAIDARPRILARTPAQRKPRGNLVDLEHECLSEALLPKTANLTNATSTRRSRRQTKPALNAASCWTLPQVHLTAVLQQQQPFRDSQQPQVNLVLLPNDDEDDYLLTWIAEPRDRLLTPIEEKNNRVLQEHLRNDRLVPWGAADYLTELKELAEAVGLTPYQCAERYGTVTLPRSDQGWWFHPALGFTSAK